MPTQIPIRWYPIAAGGHASFSRSDLEVPVFTLGGDIGQNVYELRRDMLQFSLNTLPTWKGGHHRIYQA